VSPLPFLIPLFGKDGMVNKTVAKAYRTALWLYDLTGGVRIGKRHKRLTHDEALGHLPTLKTDLLAAAFLYWDAQADDARLTLTVVRTAVVEHGAVAANYARVRELVHDANGKVAGAVLRDGTEIRARSVVNAAGVWTDDVRSLDEGTHPDSITPAKGVHLTVPASKLPCDIAAVVPVPHDRRSIFVVPWGDFTYIGTTDTEYDGPVDDPQVTPEDVEYVLAAINTWVTSKLSPEDVTGSWAGLRPLMKAESNVRTADLSRRHSVLVSDQNLVTISGGKLTTYRHMAHDTVEACEPILGRKLSKSRTKSLRLRGAEGFDEVKESEPHLARRYGGEARTLRAMIEADATLGDALLPGLPYLKAEAVFAARYEMAQSLDDVLARRTRSLLLGRDVAADHAEDVARLIAGELGWDDAEVARQAAAFRALAEHERTSAGLPRTATHSVS
jgi:glycerol-3-phosphate dehydrogenase